MQLKDFAAHVAEKFNVHKIEPWSPVFPSTDAKYLEEFRSATEKANSAVVDIAVDQGHSQYAMDATERESAVDRQQAMDRYRSSACFAEHSHAHRQRQGFETRCRTCGRYTVTRRGVRGDKKNVVVHLENDNPVSEDPFFIVQVIEKVNSPWLRALAGFRQFAGRP